MPYFRNVYMRNNLPKRGPWDIEWAIVNLDDVNGPGSHWVCYIKRYAKVWYYDSFGNLKPPLELIAYFRQGKVDKIFYNYRREQEFNTVLCGHLCLKFLCKNLSFDES